MVQKKVTKTQQILDFIGSQGSRGAAFGEIQRFIVELNGKNYDEKQVINPWEVRNGKKPKYARMWRGYWCDALFGGGYPTWKQGILATYCVKIGRQYFLKDSEGYREALEKAEATS